jgi:hypothetical protein
MWKELSGVTNGYLLAEGQAQDIGEWINSSVNKNIRVEIH